jgi:hypothetical protein
MPAANKFNDFVNQKNRAKHDWSTHAFKIALTNTAPVATNSILSDIVQIAAGNGYTTGGNALTGITLGMAGGTLTVGAAQVVFTGVTAAMGTFRYYVLYNDTTATPVKPLVMWWDHGSAVTLNPGDTFTVQFNGSNPGTIFTDA